MRNDKKARTSTVETRGDRGWALISFSCQDKLVRSFLKATENIQQHLKFLFFLLDSRLKTHRADVGRVWDDPGSI